MTNRTARRFTALLILVALLLLPIANTTAVRFAQAEWITLKARWQIARWQQRRDHPWNLAEWGAARDALIRAHQIAPEHPKILDDLGALYALQGFRNLPNRSLAEPFLRQALAYYRAGLIRRPSSSNGWANIAVLLAYLEPNSEKLWQAFDRALEYGPNEPEVLIALAQIAFPRWNELAPPRQTALLTRLAVQPAHLKKQIEKIAKNYQLTLPVMR